MNRIIFIFLFAFIFTYSYSQKIQRWKINDSIYCEVVEDFATYKIENNKKKNSINLGFLGDYNKDTIKVIKAGKVLLDTVLSVRNEENEYKEFKLIPVVLDKKCCSEKIEFVFNRKQLSFPFKKGYSLIYFFNYPDRINDDRTITVYSIEYTNKYRIRL